MNFRAKKLRCNSFTSFMRVATVTKCGWQCVPGVFNISIDTCGVQILQGDVTSVVFLKEVDYSFA